MAEPTVVFAAHNFPPRIGGVERLADGLVRHTWPGSTTVLAAPTEGDAAFDADAPYPVERVPMVGRRPPRWWPARRALATHARRADVVVAVEWWPEARALASLRRHGETRVVILCGTEVQRSLTRPRARRSLVRGLRACDLVLAISRFTASLAAEAGVAATILNPGVDLNQPSVDPAKLAASLGVAGHPIVLTAARLVERKGHADFLAAWPAVRAACPEAVWLIVGDGPERHRLATATRAVDGVRLIGAVDDETLAGLYRLADIHLMPGREVDGHVEGFGMAAVEAGAAGTPTIATSLGGTEDAVGPGGILVAPGDTAKLVQEVGALLNDDGRRRMLSTAARTHAQSLAWPLVADRLRDLVEVVRERGKR